ncbi:MAG: prepilin peptidase [Sphingomonadaceae bacterium]
MSFLILAPGLASAVAVSAFVLLAAEDVEHRRIPDRFSAAIAATGVLALPALPFSEALWSLALGALAFAIGLWAFARGLVGGGDVKLLPGAMLWAGPSLLALFSVAMALASLAVAFAILARRALCRRRDVEVGALHMSLPLGLPIAIAGILIILHRVALLPIGAL